jgi:hypothetical protein
MDPKILYTVIQKLDERVAGWAYAQGADPDPSIYRQVTQYLSHGREPFSLPALIEWLAQLPEFAQWAARSPSTSQEWNPLEQSFASFCQAHPDAEPYLRWPRPREPNSIRMGLQALIDECCSR